jgi:hypothetical protein
MKKAPNPNLHLSDHISRALNKIRKPSTAGELLNLDLAQRGRPFQETDVAEWLRDTEDAALKLYWAKARPESKDPSSQVPARHTRRRCGPDPGEGPGRGMSSSCVRAVRWLVTF